ncbi:transglutaminase-like domain-containing protein [Pectinatus sottacetonis]|uniref:transglutaminase-like domain-containing protein n=1 Tax=Pectinatus sottacetonis TaxID=1002795 RepID=UPI0018C4968B|nr:transglutaminase-like domain-containing protein [Pectinatus sottacetonis]
MKKEKSYYSRIGQTFLLWWGLITILNCLYSYAGFSLTIKEITFSLIICLVLYLLNFIDNKSRKFITCIILLGIGIYFIYRYNQQLYISLLYTANAFINSFKEPYHLNLICLKVPYNVEHIAQIQAAFLLLAIMAIFFRVFMSSKRGCILLLLITAPLYMMGLYFDVFPSMSGIAGMVSFWTAMGIYINGNFTSKTYIYAVFAVIMIFAAGAVIQRTIPQSEYKHPNFAQYIPQSITNLLNEYLSPSGRATAMDDILHGINGRGQLGDMDSLTQTGRKMMQVETSLQAVQGNLYLRNYSGAIYKNNSWYDLPEKDYEWNSHIFDTYSAGAWYDQSVIIFSALQNDQHGQDLLQKYIQGTDTNGNIFLAHQFKITRLYDGVRQIFLPYNADVSSSIFKYDKLSVRNNKGIYQVTAYNMPSDYSGVDLFLQQYSGSNKFINYYYHTEREYRKFVYEYYRQVPPGILDKFAEKFPIPEAVTPKQKDAFIAALQAYFQKNYKYTTAPGKLPPGQDFVSYFLNKSHEGYCTYFASAAVLILRKAGIPARYVVGYAVPNKIIARAEIVGIDSSNDNIHSFTVIDKQAHAWVEIYQDGWGWRPVDFTPADVVRKQSSSVTQNHTSVHKPSVGQQNNGENRVKNEQKQVVKKIDKTDGSHMEVNIKSVVGILLVCILLLLVYRIKKYNMIIKQIFYPDNITIKRHQHILKLYDYMEKLVYYRKIIHVPDMEYLKYASYLSEKEIQWCNIPIKDFMVIVLKARFSEDEISYEEWDTAVTVVKNMRMTIYDKLNIWQKVLFKYIYGL